MARFGGYTLHEQLGAGAGGPVHRASLIDKEGVQRSVAIRRLRSELLATAGAAEWFVEEVRRLTRVRHPNVAGLYRAGRVGDEVFLEMEHVRGVSLDEILHEVRTDGPPPIEVIVSLLFDLFDGLAFAHGQRIVHGGLRPSQVIVDETGRAKLIGFVTGCLARSDAPNSYAAPETLDGLAPDMADDLFSAGVIAYELVTGRPLFDDATDAEVRRFVGERAPPLSAYNPECPTALDGAIARALAPSREVRTVSAHDMRLVMASFGGSRPASVVEWLEPGGSDESAKRIALPLPPPARERMARGSARMSSPPGAPASAVVEPAAESDIHEAPTVLHEAPTPEPFELQLPIVAQPEPYIVLEDTDIPIIEEAEELALEGWVTSPVVPPLAARESAATARSRLRRALELGVAFAAGATAMYLLLELVR